MQDEGSYKYDCVLDSYMCCFTKAETKPIQFHQVIEFSD